MILALQIAQLSKSIDVSPCLNYRGKSTIRENAIIASGKFFNNPSDFVNAIDIDTASSAAAVIIGLKSNFDLSIEDLYGLLSQKYNFDGDFAFVKQLLLALDNTSGEVQRTVERVFELPIPTWMDEMDLLTGTAQP